MNPRKENGRRGAIVIGHIVFYHRFARTVSVSWKHHPQRYNKRECISIIKILRKSNNYTKLERWKEIIKSDQREENRIEKTWAEVVEQINHHSGKHQFHLFNWSNTVTNSHSLFFFLNKHSYFFALKNFQSLITISRFSMIRETARSRLHRSLPSRNEVIKPSSA